MAECQDNSANAPNVLSSPDTAAPFRGFPADDVVYTPPPSCYTARPVVPLLEPDEEVIFPTACSSQPVRPQLGQNATSVLVGADGDRRRYGAQRGATAPHVGEHEPTIETRIPECLRPHKSLSQWHPSTSEEFFAKTLNEAIDKLATTLRKPKRTSSLPPTYCGSDWEDPKLFLAEAEAYCRLEEVEHREWVLVIADRLRGAAHAWYDNYRGLNMNYASFRQRLLDRFDNSATLSSLHAKLYGQRQPSPEDTSLFISRKLALFRRVAPSMAENLIILQLRELLHPDIRLSLRGVQLFSVEQLIQLATSIEGDLKERTPARQQSVSKLVPHNRLVTGKPPYPCRFCEGNHFHKDCPRRPTSSNALPAAQNARWGASAMPTAQQYTNRPPVPPRTRPPPPPAAVRAIMPPPAENNNINSAQDFPCRASQH